MFKDFRKIVFGCVLIITTPVLANDERRCAEWESNPKVSLVLPLDHLCAVSLKSESNRPDIFHKDLTQGRFDFLIGQKDLALLLKAEDLQTLVQPSDSRDRLLRTLAPDLLQVWHAEALQWQAWEESFYDGWFGHTSK